jgi:hypothetical protein
MKVIAILLECGVDYESAKNMDYREFAALENAVATVRKERRGL